jgi:hypothetical protein
MRSGIGLGDTIWHHVAHHARLVPRASALGSLDPVCPAEVDELYLYRRFAPFGAVTSCRLQPDATKPLAK